MGDDLKDVILSFLIKNLDRPLPLVEVTAQTVGITAAVSAAYFRKGMARHLDQRERSMNQTHGENGESLKINRNKMTYNLTLTKIHPEANR